MSKIAIDQGEQTQGTGGNRWLEDGAQGVWVYVVDPLSPPCSQNAIRKG